MELRLNISLALGLAAIHFLIWPRPYVAQKTPANQSDAHALFTLAESGWM